MVRVLHRGVNYDTSVGKSALLDIVVFDSVARIQNLQAKLGHSQVESDGQVLKITEMYAISNQSTPPSDAIRGQITLKSPLHRRPR